MDVVDVIRLATMTAGVIAAITFPAAIWLKGHGTTWTAVVGCDLLILGVSKNVADHWGEPLAWHRTGLLVVATGFILWFVLSTFLDEWHERDG